MSAPIIKFNLFSVDAATPSGSRHLETAPNFVKKVDASATGTLDFGVLNNTSAKTSSSTFAVVPFVSNLNGNSTVENMKFWQPVQTSITAGTYAFNQHISTAWSSGIALTDASGTFSSSTLPTSQNVTAADGSSSVSTAATDASAMEFVYLSVTADTDVAQGTYGGSDGSIKYRLTFDYS